VGKIENVKKEMKINEINILGLSEVRWKNNEDFMSDDKWVIYQIKSNYLFLNQGKTVYKVLTRILLETRKGRPMVTATLLRGRGAEGSKSQKRSGHFFYSDSGKRVTMVQQ